MQETLEVLTGHPLEGDGRITKMFLAVGALSVALRAPWVPFSSGMPMPQPPSRSIEFTP